MKAKRFSEEQIIGVLKEGRSRREDQGFVSPARYLGSDLLQLESQVRRGDGVGGAAAEGARAGERQAQTTVGRTELDKAALKDLLHRKW